MCPGERDRRRELHGGDRRHSPFPDPRSSWGISAWTPVFASQDQGRRPTAISQSRARSVHATRWWRRAGARVRQPGPLRVLRAHPCTPRALRRDRRRREKARVPFLGTAHTPTGLSLRAALADQEEAQAAADHRRRPALHTQSSRHLRRHHRGPRGRARARSPGRGRLRQDRPRLARRTNKQGGRERDTGARTKQALKGQSRAADHKPQTSALRYVSHSRPKTLSHRTNIQARPLTFIRRPEQQSGAAGTMTSGPRTKYLCALVKRRGRV